MKAFILTMLLLPFLASAADPKPTCYGLWKGERFPERITDQLCMVAVTNSGNYHFDIKTRKKDNWESVASLSLENLRVIGCPACNYTLFGIKGDMSALAGSMQIEFRGSFNYEDKTETGKVFVFGTEYNYRSM